MFDFTGFISQFIFILISAFVQTLLASLLTPLTG